MNKKLLIALLTCSSLLSSCNPTPSETHTPDVTPSETVTEDTSSSTESIEVNSSSEETLEKDDSIFPYESFNMGVGESYNIRHMVKEAYSNAWLDIYVDDISLLQPDAEDNINGLKEGTTHIKLVVEETYYDEFDVNVLDIQEFTKQMKLDKGRLQGKSFTVFGDSISDVSVTAYPSDRPTFWCEQLASMFDMTMYNYAISGSTTGYCKGLVDRSPDFAYLVGTWVVRKDEVIKNIAKSDYAFIYFGNNDATYACNIGEFGDVND